MGVAPGRDGEGSASDTVWDAIIGVIGYAFDWGDLVTVWRYLNYNMPSDYSVEDLNLNGAAISVTFHF